MTNYKNKDHFFISEQILVNLNAVFAIAMNVMAEAATRDALWKVFLEISQNSQENICTRVSFSIVAEAEAYNFIKKEILAQVSSCEFCEIFKNTSFTEHLRWLLLVMG